MTMKIEKFVSAEFGGIRVGYNEQVELLFCAKDVCNALGYGNSREAIRKHVEMDDVTKRDTIDSLGRTQSTTFINESGLYALILASKLDSARRFKHWITSEVLPNIRKHGGYMKVRPNESDEELMARALQIANVTLQKKDKQIDLLQPKADYADEVLLSVDCLTTSQIAKELGMTAQALNKLLCEKDIQYGQSGQYLLKGDYVRMGLAQNRTFTYRDSKGGVRTQTQMVWTEKGRLRIHNLIKRLRQQATYDLFSMNNDLQTINFNTHINYEEII